MLLNMYLISYCYFQINILNLSILISNTVNIDRYNPHKQKLFEGLQ